MTAKQAEQEALVDQLCLQKAVHDYAEPKLRRLEYFERHALVELSKRSDGWDAPEAHLGRIHLEGLERRGLVVRKPQTRIPLPNFHHWRLTRNGVLVAMAIRSPKARA